MKIVRGIEAVLLFGENPRKLAEFYRDVVGLKLSSEMEMGEKGEEAFSFENLEGTNLYILHHSKVKTRNSQPERIMFNLEVAGAIEDAVDELKKKDAKLIQNTYHVEEYGKIATFEDPDGNYFQLVQTKPTKEEESNS